MSKLVKKEIEERLKCPVCLERFKLPKILPCQHTFCQTPCLEKSIDEKLGKLKCPQCRALHKIPFNGVQGFPPNLTIMDFLDMNFMSNSNNFNNNGRISELKNNDPVSLAVCGQCSKQNEILMDCVHCRGQFCAGCKSAHLINLTNFIQKKISHFKSIQPALKHSLKNARQSQDSVLRNADALKYHISSRVNDLINELKNRERILHEEVDKRANQQIENIEVIHEKTNTDLQNLTNHIYKTDEFLKRHLSKKSVEEVEKRGIFFEHYDADIRNFESNMSISSTRQCFNDLHYNELVHFTREFGELDYEKPKHIEQIEREHESPSRIALFVDKPKIIPRAVNTNGIPVKIIRKSFDKNRSKEPRPIQYVQTFKSRSNEMLAQRSPSFYGHDTISQPKLTQFSHIHQPTPLPTVQTFYPVPSPSPDFDQQTVLIDLSRGLYTPIPMSSHIQTPRGRQITGLNNINQQETVVYPTIIRNYPKTPSNKQRIKTYQDSNDHT